MNRKIIIAFLIGLLVSSDALFAENPFSTRFGGPYPTVELSFKQQCVLYGQFWMRTLSVLGKEALKDKAGLAEFLKTEVNPRLDALKATTPEEEKIKAAAILVKTVFESQVDPSKFTKDELASIDAFLSSASTGEEAQSLGDKIGYVLIRYQEFVIGMTFEQMKKLQK